MIFTYIFIMEQLIDITCKRPNTFTAHEEKKDYFSHVDILVSW